MRHLYLFLLLFPAFCCAKTCCGKIEVGPVYSHLKMIEDHRTVKHLDVWGGRIDANVSIYKGLVLKPMAMILSGDGDVQQYGAGLGFCLPINQRLTVMPVAGYTYGELYTIFHQDVPLEEQVLELSVRTTYYSNSGYGGLEASYTISEGTRLHAIFHYAFVRIKSQFKTGFDVFDSTSVEHSQGPNYALILEKDLNNYWSVNIAGALNTALSKDKNGSKAFGLKLGIVRWLYW